MKNILQDIKLITKNAQEMRRVFLNSDLSVLLNSSGKQLYDRIQYLIQAEVLQKGIRGVYLTEGWELKDVAARINPESYITGPTILAEQLMIGTIPQKKLYCVKKGSPRTYTIKDKMIQFHSLQPALYFGYEVQEGYRKALPEKALLDTLYFYLRGESYFFDLFSDVNISVINQERFFSYLKRYKNSKFRSFAGNYLKGINTRVHVASIE